MSFEPIKKDFGGILVFQPANSITIDHFFAMRENIKAQLADDPRFLIVYPHINVHYLRPGDSLEASIKLLDVK